MKTASYKITANQRLTATVTELTLEPLSQDHMIRPVCGQYAAIRFSRGSRISPARCFSITNAPGDHGTLQFAMRTTGAFTRTAANLERGDQVVVQGPYGQFVLEPHDTRPVVMLAGGIGVTPFVSIIRGLAATKSPRRVNLLYSQSSEADIPFATDLVRLERTNPNLRTTFVITSGRIARFSEVRHHRGYISRPLLDSVGGDYTATRFYVCGSGPFMRTAIKLLKDNRVQLHQITTEAFAQGARQSEPGARLVRRVYSASAASVLAMTAIVAGGNLIHTATEVDAANTAMAARETPSANATPAVQTPNPTLSATPAATPLPTAAPSETAETPAPTPQATVVPTPAQATPAPTPEPTQTTQQPVSQVS